MISIDVMNNIRDIAINYSNLEYDLEKGKEVLDTAFRYIIIEITGGSHMVVITMQQQFYYY